MRQSDPPSVTVSLPCPSALPPYLLRGRDQQSTNPQGDHVGNDTFHPQGGLHGEEDVDTEKRKEEKRAPGVSSRREKMGAILLF
jgi:hypothetical protein